MSKTFEPITTKVSPVTYKQLMNICKKKGITILCIRRSDADPKKPRRIIIPQASDIIESDDKLIVFGETRQIDNLS